MGNLPYEMYKTTRKTIIEIVLNTEISRHFYLMSTLKTKLGNNFPDILNLDDRILVLSICQRVSDSMKIARDSRIIFKRWYEQFFEEIEAFGGDERKMEERPFNHGVLMMPEDKFRDILDIVPIRATYLSHLILEWFEDTKLADARTMFGRDDIDVDELSINPKTADVCVPPPTKPDDITRDEMIDYIVTGTLFKKDDIEKRSDEWIEKMYLGKLRNQKEKELRGE